MNKPLAAVIAAFLTTLLAGCVTPGTETDPLVRPASLGPTLETTRRVETLPSPSRAVDVAVYAFPDKTGQNKPEENFSSFSRAVTQGAEAILIDVLEKAGRGRWFNVVERVGLSNLVQERSIIEQTRQQYDGPGAKPLPPLRFAGMLIEGGVISFDSNDLTGGAGARFLGIGADTQYRRDYVTVSLRAVSVESGEVLASVTTAKTVYSTLLRGQGFHFVSLDEILEIEAGFTRNEPTGLAVRQAIELGVYALILEGSRNGLWSFSDPGVARPLLDAYDHRYGQGPSSKADEVATVAGR